MQKEYLKKIIGIIKKIKKKVSRKIFPENLTKNESYFIPSNLMKKDLSVLLSLLRHDCHRLEKGYCNNYFNNINKAHNYDVLHSQAKKILEIIETKYGKYSDPTLEWSKKIVTYYPNIEKYYNSEKKISKKFDIQQGIDFLSQLQSRRSCRNWSNDQPNKNTLLEISEILIQAAISSPNSGNRQAWKFIILIDNEDKQLLKWLKEPHCINAPLLIFVGMDSRFYEYADDMEYALYYDAAAALMQIVNTGHFMGLGTCWNYLSIKQINSRPQNQEAYRDLVNRYQIEPYIIPCGIVSIGVTDFFPPKPDRLPIDEIMLKRQ
jgi:nitroreductase